MELSVAIQAKVEVTPSNWNFGFQPTFEMSIGIAGDRDGIWSVSQIAATRNFGFMLPPVHSQGHSLLPGRAPETAG